MEIYFSIHFTSEMLELFRNNRNTSTPMPFSWRSWMGSRPHLPWWRGPQARAIPESREEQRRCRGEGRRQRLWAQGRASSFKSWNLTHHLLRNASRVIAYIGIFG